MNNEKILIVGCGLAGSEAANLLTKIGYDVVLFESKFVKLNAAQKIKACAELVCTNSLKSKEENSAHGYLKYEMNKLGSIVLKVAELTKVPAGGALAVNREKFSEQITSLLTNNSKITLISEDLVDPIEAAEKYNCSNIIIATGPLTNDGLQNWMSQNIGQDGLYFYDAIAPVVEFDSLDTKFLYYKDRYQDQNINAAYLNCPLTKDEYFNFINLLKEAEKVPAQNFEKQVFFESCLPVDLMAERGIETARFSCMKPVGLEVNGKRPYACVQLRKENLAGSAYNLVGFQTRLTYKEQLRIFRTLPGFSNANFLHLGSVHRNTFLNGKKLFNLDFSLKKYPNIYLAGQISGVEGYTESAAIGLFSALAVDYKIRFAKDTKPFLKFPETTAIGALVNYVLTNLKPSPSNINLGLFPDIEMNFKKIKRKDKKRVKRELVFSRAKRDFDKYFEENLKDTIYEQ